MIKIIKDLGKIYYNNNSKQRVSCVLVECDICKIQKTIPKTRLKNKDRYICRHCSAIINGRIGTEKIKAFYAELNKDENYVLKKKETVRKCNAECSKRYKEKHPDRVKNTYYQRTYNISLEEFNEMSKNGCYICGSKEKLCVDHCHETGVVRGILCDKHNKVLGLLGDELSVVKQETQKIIEYLEKQNTFLPKQIIMEKLTIQND